jgi:putative sigma-54 modulation protein
VKKNIHKAEVNLNSEEGKTFFCEASSEDMYSSLDLLFDRLERQVRKYKEKLMNHKAVTSIALNFLKKRQSDEENVRISKVKEMLPRPMTVHEAILQLSINSHKFEMFQEDKLKDQIAIALKNDAELYSIIEKDNGSWEQKDYKLIDNNIELLSKAKTAIDELDQLDAVDRLLEEDLEYLVFYDKEVKNMNILYVRKDHTLGLITSA